MRLKLSGPICKSSLQNGKHCLLGVWPVPYLRQFLKQDINRIFLLRRICLFKRMDNFRIHGPAVRFGGSLDPAPHPVREAEDKLVLLVAREALSGHKAHSGLNDSE